VNLTIVSLSAALSGDAPTVRLSKYLPTLPQTHSVAVFVGAMARGRDDFADAVVDEKISISDYSLSASVACGKVRWFSIARHLHMLIVSTTVLLRFRRNVGRRIETFVPYVRFSVIILRIFGSQVVFVYYISTDLCNTPSSPPPIHKLHSTCGTVAVKFTYPCYAYYRYHPELLFVLEDYQRHMGCDSTRILPWTLVL
jgi:hypothetical protein